MLHHASVTVYVHGVVTVYVHGVSHKEMFSVSRQAGQCATPL